MPFGETYQISLGDGNTGPEAKGLWVLGGPRPKAGPGH